MFVCNSSLPSPHREDNALVDNISGWPSAGATSNRPQSTLSTTNIPRFYQRPISGKVPIQELGSQTYSQVLPYHGTLLLSKPFEHSSQDFDFLALKRKYSATTQTAWNEVNWNKKLRSTFHSNLRNTKRSVPDPVANSNRIHRYYPSAFYWQKLGNSWDYVQSRNIPENKFTGFISPFRNNHKIPGYTGHTKVEGLDLSDCQYIHSNVEQQNQFNNHNYTCTSRGANIPGYSGCQHWTQTRPSHNIMDHKGVYSATTLREYSFFPSQNSKESPFTRSGVLSKMITLTNPYNPFVNQS